MADEAQLRARDGDVLVVSYGEVKIPLATKYAMIEVGGLIYTRQLQSGDDAQKEYERIYSLLQQLAERDARDKVALWTAELSGARAAEAERPAPPKPVEAPPPAARVRREAEPAVLNASREVRLDMDRPKPPALPPKPAVAR